MAASAQGLSWGCRSEPLCLPVCKEVIVNAHEVLSPLSWANRFTRVPHFVLIQTLGEKHCGDPYFPDAETEVQSQEVSGPGSKSALQDLYLICP